MGSLPTPTALRTSRQLAHCSISSRLLTRKTSRISRRTPSVCCLARATLRRPHDRDRGLRARLRAKVAPNAEHGRHVMTQAYCEHRDFPVPMRWLYAGTDLSRPDHGDQCAERPLMPSERLPRWPLQPPTSRVHTSRSLPAVLRPPSRSSLTTNPHSAAAQPGPNFPRLPALALFGRLSAERA